MQTAAPCKPTAPLGTERWELVASGGLCLGREAADGLHQRLTSERIVGQQGEGLAKDLESLGALLERASAIIR